MNYLRHKAEDLVMDESFQQYCTGTNPAAVRFWEQWLQEHPDKQELVRVARALYLRLNGGLDADTFTQHHQQFAAALAENGIKPGMQLPTGIIRRANGWKWYAIAVAAMLSGLLIMMWFMQPEMPGQQTLVAKDKRPVYVSQPGERKSFQLPDGTKVVLNAGSTLWLEDSFYNGKRTLTLEGEAYFDVAQDASAPFILHTPEMKITVLGTAFNVKAYKDDETNETSLVKGRVRVDLRAGQQVYLKPEEKVTVSLKHHTTQEIQTISTRKEPKAKVYYSIDSLTHIPHDSATVELSWVDNRLIFADESLGEIARKLERWYGVKIQFDAEELRQYRFTAHFNKETLQRVLEVLRFSREFDFRFENAHTVVLSQQKMEEKE